VISGNSLEVKLGDRAQNRKVRLLGITAPDLKQQPWGQDAKTALEKLLQNSAKTGLMLEISEEDRYGRILGYVWQDGTLINEAIAAQGYVLVDDPPVGTYREDLRHAQFYARTMGYGLWNPQQPLRQTPQQFRAKASNP
jgi:micrococcal nuclease